MGVRRARKCFRIKWLQGWACSSAGRAPALQAGGRRFDPGHVHQSSTGKINHAYMIAQPDPPKKCLFKNPFLYSWAALAIVVLVVGWMIFSRWEENRGIEKRAREERTEKQQEQDRIALERLGGKELAIQDFYAT